MGQGNCAIRLIQLLSSRRLLWPDEACVSPAKWTSTCPPAAVIDDRSAHGEWMSALCPKLGSQPASTDDRTRCKTVVPNRHERRYCLSDQRLSFASSSC